MTKKLTGKTLTGISRSHVFAENSLLDTLRPVSLCRTYALIPRPSPQGLRSRFPSHTIVSDLRIREVGIAVNRSSPLDAATGAERASVRVKIWCRFRVHPRAKGKR